MHNLLLSSDRVLGLTYDCCLHLQAGLVEEIIGDTMEAMEVCL